MSIWKPAEEFGQDAYRDTVELFRAPGGKLWGRYRSLQEFAEMEILRRTGCARTDPMMRCNQADPSACCQSTPNMVCECECHERAH